VSSPAVGSTDRPVVFLHIGEPKSGTTYLQEIAWTNREALRRHGVVYPGVKRADQFRASQDLREVVAAPDDRAPSWSGEWDALVRQALRTPRAALISQEHLCGASAEQAQRALQSLDGAEIHIVTTVRDFVSLLPAEWQETVKHRNRRAWEPWLADVLATEGADITGPRSRWFWKAHDTPAILKRWSVGIPPERVHVVTIPQTRTNPTLLWERFAGLLGVDAASVDTTRARSNATLGIVETEMLRRLNHRLPTDLPQWFYAQEVKGHVAHKLLAERPPGPRPQLPTEYLEWAGKRCDRMVDELANSGYHIVGDLEELRAPVPREEADVVDPSDAELLDAALDTLAMVLRDQHRRRSASMGAGVATPAAKLATSPRVRRAVREFGARYPAAVRARTWARTVVARRANNSDAV
jgi:hypothetical protein